VIKTAKPQYTVSYLVIFASEAKSGVKSRSLFDASGWGAETVRMPSCRGGGYGQIVIYFIVAEKV